MISPILPEILLMALGLLALGFGCTRARMSPVFVYLLLWGQLAIFIWSAVSFFVGGCGCLCRPLFGGMLEVSRLSQLSGLALQLIAIVIAWMSKRSGQKSFPLPIEFYGLLGAATVALMILVKAANLAVFFVALEASSLFVTLLLALGSPHSPGTALKYLLQSGLSAVILLWGIALVYAHTGSLQYAETAARLTDGPMVVAGVGLVLAALIFKLGAFPFSYYLPEIYEGASLPVLGFLATASKFAAAIALFILLSGPFRPFVQRFQPAFAALIAVTLVWGALSALHQSNLKRLLSLSGVVHAAFIIAAVVFGVRASSALSAVGFYFLAYIPATLLFLYSLIELDISTPTIDSLKNSHKARPGFALLMTLAVASMAGLPPLGGFIAKLLVIYSAVGLGAWGIVAAMIVASLIGLCYYLKLVFSLFGRHSDQPEAVLEDQDTRIPLSTQVFATLLVLVVILSGVFPWPAAM